MKRRYLASALSSFVLITGGACTSAYAVTFTPPANGGAPSQATGGASRGNYFTPPSGSAPSQATGGASRGNLFTPAAGSGTPNQATGGASRGNLFTPAAGNGTPQQATGGASRGNLFTPAAGSGTPQQASGGASRVGTYYINPSMVGAAGPAALIALLPQTFYGTTVSDHPTFLAYLPASNATEAVFSLKDEAGNLQYQMTIPVAGQVGVMAINLPTEAPALAVGKNYQWLLAIKVDGQLSPSTPYVDGWVQRVQPSAELTASLQQEDALKRAEALGKSGIWYDCAATLAKVYANQPTNEALTKQWAELLSSVGLQEISTVPIVATAN
ncbi:DUF928 domain-containing protein [Pantanalinema sp. GBBB05]|uniref:DUF928 domain-containing protein n=1 Tax=Pantanalinema sp. GBBB05 TaxID=2604139 RepID=UPI001DCB115D|nr:DUF928 domain-containing protein [Pantanalinema sp. GBBB05]